MPVRELRNQEAQHDSGAILRSHGRDAVQFQLADRVMTLAVERGIGGDVFFLPSALRWDDGSPVSDDDAALVRPVIEEVNAFWGSAAEFRETSRE
ncbi:hypothetical protein KZ829_32190 [Actinoplanes hulinensis]|uniref:Uncharacterized protein n=1 Tax=Actinoplanes hulinensis TaxID=1144547 RepID=A0ABS7BBS3_9ACTN|nr:hypothetical protein [Actinoplanes hulinensis]MBW6438395.1 hypothetical protein [Actinoplanes hulinensis]